MTETINEGTGAGLGVNVWYTVPQGIVIPAEDAQAAAVRNGFQECDFPVPSPRTEVSRAAHSLQDRRHKSNRRVTEKTKDNDRYVVYGILDQTRKGDEEVAFEQGTTVRFDKETGRVDAEGPLAEDFQKRYNKVKGAVTDDDVRIFLRRVVGMCFGVPKRPTGGIWFVPGHVATIVENAQAVLDELKTGAKLYLEGVVNGVRERENVWESVEGEIEKRIEETLRAVERIGKRAAGLVDHEATIAGLDELMKVYSNILGEEARHEALAEKLSDAAQTVAAKMAAMQATRMVRKAKGRKKGGSTASGGYGTQVVEAVKGVLGAAGVPLHYRDIADKAFEAGLAKRGRDPHKTVASWIAEAGRDGADSPFVRAGRGTYTLAS